MPRFATRICEVLLNLLALIYAVFCVYNTAFYLFVYFFLCGADALRGFTVDVCLKTTTMQANEFFKVVHLGPGGSINQQISSRERPPM